jgi:hypothetical protein
MEKKSKLINVQANGNWKEFYKFELEFENGESGTLYRKTNEAKVTKGEEYTYTLNDKGSIKLVNPNYAGGNGGGNTGGGYSDDDKMRMAKSVAIKSAAILHQSRTTSESDVISTADVFYNYITGTAPAKPAPSNGSGMGMADKTDLPF